jgi:hypothetical protein
MTRLRLLIVAAAGALFVGGASAVASVGATALTANDSHGKSVASAARVTCPHGQDNVHGVCVSETAEPQEPAKTTKPATTTADPCKASDPAEDMSESDKAIADANAEKAAKLTKTADKAEDTTEKSNKKADDKAEKAQLKGCEATRTK